MIYLENLNNLLLQFYNWGGGGGGHTDNDVWGCRFSSEEEGGGGFELNMLTAIERQQDDCQATKSRKACRGYFRETTFRGTTITSDVSS